MPPPDGGLAGTLRDGLLAMGLDPAAHPVDAYLDYVGLLSKWNRAYNLTAIRDPDAMLRRHVLESLTLLPYLRGKRCLDAGTGAGLPGLILALADPGRQWVLLDSNGKKIRFLEHALMTLSCRNAKAVQARLESYAPEAPFDTITSRALAPLDVLAGAARLLAPGGAILAMKGPGVEEEITPGLAARMRITLHPLEVPGAAKSTLAVMEPNADGSGPVQ